MDDSPAEDQIPLPVMGLTKWEYEAAFTYLDYANFAREVGELSEKRRRSTVLEIPRTPWYKRPECWAIIMGSISLSHGLFVQWAWPQIQRLLPVNPPKNLKPPPHPYLPPLVPVVVAVTSETL